MKYFLELIFYLILFLLIILGPICFCLNEKNEIKKDIYIQNLEEKLNIYERSYEEFCLEDSIRQVE